MRYGVFCLAALAAFAQTTRRANDTERARLSDMASRMLERTVQARAALDKGDQGMARHYVEEALNNVTAIEIEQPKAPSPRMVTLYTETVQISVEKPKPVAAELPRARQTACKRRPFRTLLASPRALR